MKDFKELKVWKKAHELTLDVYRATDTFPKAEWFGLRSQIRRASSSIGANLAEGCGRRRDGEFGRFVSIALGSASELECHLLLARDLRYLEQVTHEHIQAQLDEICRMLMSLQQCLQVAKDAERQLAARS
jgi:four helix bundle protein